MGEHPGTALDHINPMELVSDPPTPAVVADRLGMDDEWVLNRLRDVAETALEGTPVYDRDGNETGKAPQLGAANNALHTIAQARGMLREQHEHTHQGTVRIEIVGVNTNQLT